MKLKRLSLLLLIFIFVISVVPSSALLSDNVHVHEFVAQQAWFTKLIKFDNFRGKDISGTLNFELVPDKTANAKYYEYGNKPNDEGDNQLVQVVQGVVNHAYKTSFSSNDYVDKEFVKLAWDSGDRCGDSTELMDHAFLHEWGRIVSSDHCFTCRVGKINPEQFETAIPYIYANKEEAKTAYEKQKELLREEDKAGRGLKWDGDDDTEDVIGWKTGIEYPSNPNNPQYDFLGDFQDNYGGRPECLNRNEKFRDGTFKVTEAYTLKANPAVTYFMPLTTRHIALDKTYDKDGNIKSIEVPLLPAIEAHNFSKNHCNALNEKYGDEAYEKSEYKIFRYRLKEKQAEGINLSIADKDIIVDIIGYGDNATTIFMFNNEKSADEFYKNYFSKEMSSLSGIKEKENGVDIKKSDKVQLVNQLENTEVPIKKVWKDENNKYGDRPDSVSIKLYANDKDTGKILVLNKDNNWNDVFANLPLKEDGNIIKYTIKEEKIAKYRTQITGNAKDGFVITNTHKNIKPKKDSPKTGDSDMGLLFMGIAGLGIAGLAISMKKKKSN